MIQKGDIDNLPNILCVISIGRDGKGSMNVIIKLVKCCWSALNFIRNIVMNVVFLIFVLLMMAILTFAFESTNKKVVLEGDQGALLLNLEGYLQDNRDERMSWANILKELDNQYVPRPISTFDVVYAIENAKADPKIRGLVLDLNYFEGADLATLEYIGNTIKSFKESQKPVIAYSDNYTQGQYLLASYADEIILNPMGAVAIEGMVAENLYFKSLLEQFEVTPHIFRVGTYKAAVEPFLRDNMSPEAKANIQQWLGKMWQHYQNIVAENRQIPMKQVLPDAKTYWQELKALNGDSSKYAKQRNLVTHLADRFTLRQQLIERFGKSEENEPKWVKFDDYLASLPDRLKTEERAKIAVVNVEGAIIDGESDEESVGGDTIVRLLTQAYMDDHVKAVILRVNSPGGSAFASELIRQELENLQNSGKPVVVSMGDMAASGGYWISSTADYIVAENNTLTGSIGIFSVLPTFEKTIKKAGVSTDYVTTTDLAMKSVFSPLSESQRDIIQLEIEQGYDKFLSLVSQGRKMTKEQVDHIAQGQVWLGVDAYQNKLVDELGDFDLAVKIAGQLVNNRLSDEEKIDDFAVEWIVDEEISLFSSVMRDMRKNSQSQWKDALLEMLGMPKAYQQIKKQLGILTQFNDPKGQYLYCLNCSEVKK